MNKLLFALGYTGVTVGLCMGAVYFSEKNISEKNISEKNISEKNNTYSIYDYSYSSKEEINSQLDHLFFKKPVIILTKEQKELVLNIVEKIAKEDEDCEIILLCYPYAGPGFRKICRTDEYIIWKCNSGFHSGFFSGVYIPNNIYKIFIR